MSESDEEFNKAIETIRKVSKEDPEKARVVDEVLKDSIKKETLITQAENYTEKLVDVFNHLNFDNFKTSEIETYINAIKQDVKKYSGRFGSL